MRINRQLEMSADCLYSERKIRGFCHFSIGQEAIAVGIEHSITKDDKVITAYRCHGNILMRGASVRQIIGEVLGRRGGMAYGQGGSVHMYYKNFFGGNGIVGAQVPVGAGIAFAQQCSSTNNITINLYGDGAANQGQVFEAFNIAKLWNLPVIFGCESKYSISGSVLNFFLQLFHHHHQLTMLISDNQFAMGTSATRGSALTDYYKRGQYIPKLRINGMYVLSVLAATKFGKEYLLSGQGPLVYEFVAYRFFGHSVSDPETTYRTRADVKKMRDSADPILNYVAKLIAWGVASKTDLKEVEKEIKAEVEEEPVEAEKIPFPEAVPATLFEDSYVRGSEPDYIRGRTPDENYYFS